MIETATTTPGAADEAIIARSREEDRILLTFDRDVGRILQSDRGAHPGVVFLRLSGTGEELWDTFKRVWPRVEPIATSHFVTVRNRQVRSRPLPMQLER